MISKQTRDTARCNSPLSCGLGRISRTLIACACVLITLWQRAEALEPLATQIQFDIPENTSLEDALIYWGIKTGLSVMINTKTVDLRKTRAVRGTLRAEDALKLILSETGLSYTTDGTGVQIVPLATIPKSSHKTSYLSSGPPNLSDLEQSDGSDQPSSDNGAHGQGGVSEVIVTAEKRAERLQDVPMSLTALSGSDLQESQSFRFEDYIGTVPGLTMIDSPLGTQLVIRGVTTGSNINSSVATYIDETPYTAVGAFAGSTFIAPNLDTFDMQRIEVLRGPQGTLYGSNALGGILKYVTNAPDPSRFSSVVELGGSTVDDGGAGYDARGMVNLPLTNNSALRLVGYDVLYPGFVDDSLRNRDDVNASRYTGGRASFLVQPNEGSWIRFNAVYQERRWGDSASGTDVDPVTLQPFNGQIAEQHLISQPVQVTTQLYNVTMNWDLDPFKILSTTSYARYQPHALIDYSDLYGPALAFFLGKTYGAGLVYDTPLDAFTQEVRLSGNINALEWQVGGFYTHQTANEFEGIYPIDTTTRDILYDYPGGVGVGVFHIDSKYREYAGFANLDYHITQSVDVSVGGRYSDNKQSFHEIGLGLFGGGADITTPSSEGVFTYSGDVRWRMTPTQMLYTRIAEGFVPGGPNDIIPTATAAPSYKSSTTRNYEIGVKSDFFDHRLTVDVSAFDIEWQDIQLQALIDDLSEIVNGGRARSYGAEWSANYVPLNGLTLGVNGAYTNAHLTEATPASVGGLPGDRLPYVPEWSGSANASYERPVSGAYSAFFGVDWKVIGDEYSTFEAAGTPRFHIPSYDIVDLRAGLRATNWSVTLYVKNVGNALGITDLNSLDRVLTGTPYTYATNIYTPRTIGGMLTVKF